MSVPRHIRFAELKKKNEIEQPHFTNDYVIFTLGVSDIFKILGKKREIAPLEQFFLFFTVFCYLLLDFYVKTGITFSLRDKQLFEIREVETMRVYRSYA